MKPRRQVLSVSLPQDLIALLKQVAQAEKTSVSALVETLINKTLDAPVDRD